jgi:hypothetical protein
MHWHLEWFAYRFTVVNLDFIDEVLHDGFHAVRASLAVFNV